MASHGVESLKTTTFSSLSMVFFKSMAPGSTSPSEIRIKMRRALHIAQMEHYECFNAILFQSISTNLPPILLLYIYIHITIYRYGIVAEGSETHHFRGRQNSPKEVPTCLMYPEMCLWPSYLSVTKKSRQLAAASHPDPASRWCFSKRRRTSSKPAWNTGAWMQGLPGLSTTEANMGLSKRCTLW